MRNLILIVLALMPLAQIAAIDFSKSDPKVGESIEINLDKPSDHIVISYRPNSGVTIQDTIAAEQPATTYQWMPEYPGVVMVSSPNESANISVRFASASISGIIVMILAFTILFGGAFFAFRLLFSDKSFQDIDLSERADT